jgi:hypothetical protein
MHIKCIKLQVTYKRNLPCMFQWMFAVFREMIIQMNFYKLVWPPPYYDLPEDGEHSPKHVGEIMYTDNL